MKYSAVIAFGLLLFEGAGCQENNPQIVGNYSICKPTAFERFIYNKRGVQNTVAGSSLSLKYDSTFIYTTCGNIMTGKWQTKNHLLLLLPTSNKYRFDSLNFIHTCKIPTEPLQYEISDNKLYKVLQFTSGSSLELFSKK